MKTQILDTPLIVSEEAELEMSKMGMDASGVDMATYYMRDKIYSDKILAVVREYGANAADEHRKHNIDKPVILALTNTNTGTEFSVRDFGKGLCEDDIRKVFGMYFKSTKNKSNGGNGGFGVGSKAGHCYTDTFKVESFHEGKYTEYFCMLGGGDSGIPIGQIMKVSEEDATDTPSGIRISLDVNKGDTEYFRKQALRFTHHCQVPVTFQDGILQATYKTPTPDVVKSYSDGVQILYFKHNSTDLYPFTDNFTSKCALVMGDVVYDEEYSLDYQSQEYDTMVVFPIGSLSLPISRENIETTESNTRKLKKLQLEYKADYKEEERKLKENSKFENLFSDFARLVYPYSYDRVFSKGFYRFSPKTISPELYKFFRLIDKTIFYKGELEDRTQTPITISNLSVMEHGKNAGKIPIAILPQYYKARDNKLNSLVHNSIIADKSFLFCSNDDRKKLELFFNEVPELEKLFFLTPIRGKFFGTEYTKNARKNTYTYFFFNNNNGRKHAGGRGCAYTIEGKSTALELHNNTITETFKLPPCASNEEAKTQMEKLVFENSNQLRRFFIRHTTSPKTDLQREYLTTASVKFHDELVEELGWFSADDVFSDTYKLLHKFYKEEDAKRKHEDAVDSFNLKFFKASYANKLKEKFKKSKKHFDLFSKLLVEISTEKTLRGVVVNSILKQYRYSFSNGTITRKEFRKILSL